MPKPPRTGYHFYSVETPDVFRECELPTDPGNDTPNEAKLRADLESLAEQHGTYVKRIPYRIG